MIRKPPITLDWLFEKFEFAAIAKDNNETIYGYTEIPTQGSFFWIPQNEPDIVPLSPLFSIPELQDIEWQQSLVTNPDLKICQTCSVTLKERILCTDCVEQGKPINWRK